MDLFTWNDMNEPSVFNGPEVSMPKDAKNLAGVEHREWHNLYGLYMQRATAEGLADRTPLDAAKGPAFKQRPFVLSRAFWAGSQKFGAIWTGDNTAEWGHLKVAAPMLLSINLAGLSFAGSDVGGFFGEPGAELFTRWYQAGSFTPFFRGHAHHDTKRREPWVFGEPYTTILRAAAMTRYSLLPYWYTVFYQAATLGLPVMRTMFSEYPHDPAVLAMQDQWMVGSALLVVPVTDSGRSSIEAYLPRGSWYSLYSLAKVEVGRDGTTAAEPAGGMQGQGRHVTLRAPLDTIPALLRGGSIVPRKMRLRRSSKLMFFDPYTLVVVPSDAGRAEGRLYLDDEISLAHEDPDAGMHAYRCVTSSSPQICFLICFISSSIHLQCPFNLKFLTPPPFTFTLCRKFEFSGSSLSCSGSGRYAPPNTVERIDIAGQSRAPTKATLRLAGGSAAPVDLTVVFDAATGVVTIKKPDCRVCNDWTIDLSY